MGLLHDWLWKPRPRVISKVFAECTGVMLFHFIGSVSPTPWANGIALIVLVYYTAKTSLAHLNPALTLTFCMLGYTNPIEVLCYWASQIVGAIFGALWLACLIPGLDAGGPGLATPGNGCFDPAAMLTKQQVFGWEALGTFSFILPIFSVVWYSTNKQGYGNTGPLIVGLSLVANAFAAGAYTGAAFNPARVLGSLIVFDCGDNARANAGYYIAGEILGAALVPLFIMPWYGIAPNAWYMEWMPTHIVSQLRTFQKDYLEGGRWHHDKEEEACKDGDEATAGKGADPGAGNTKIRVGPGQLAKIVPV